MGRTQVLENEDNQRRQSWMSGSPLFTSLFSSPPSTTTTKRTCQRSHSLKESNHHPTTSIRQSSLTMDRASSAPPIRSHHVYQKTKDQKLPNVQLPTSGPQQHSPKKSSTLANILYKAKRRPRRSVSLNSASTTITPEDPDLHAPVQLLDVDEYEADKSQLKNDFMNLAFTEEFRSTVDFRKLKQGRILDVGCGSGAWCIEMAQKYPNIEVIGIDNVDWLSDVNCLPSNCRLIQCNILNELQSELDLCSFDFIHIRFMALVFTAAQYELATRYCWKLLKPGATLELLEVDIKMCSVGPVTRSMNQEVISVAAHHGFRTDVATKLASYAPSDDCLNLIQKYRSLPMGLWGGRLGVLCRDDFLDIFRKCQTRICQFYSRPKDDKLFVSNTSIASREMEQYHTYANFHFMTVNKRPIM